MTRTPAEAIQRVGNRGHRRRGLVGVHAPHDEDPSELRDEEWAPVTVSGPPIQGSEEQIAYTDPCPWN